MAALQDAAHQLLARQAGKSGSATKGGASGPSALLSALIPIGIISIVCFTIFLVFRSKFRRIYQPRTYLGRFRKEEQTPVPSQSMFGWFGDFKRLPDDYVLNHQSIDGYLFLRFIKLCGIICAVGTLLTWPILFPVNATAPTPSVPAGSSPPSQFDLLSFSNSASSPNRYYASAFVAWVFFAIVVYAVGRESIFYVHLHQAWLMSPQTASRLSSRTVLFTDVPVEYQDEAKLRTIFPHIKHVWMATDTKDLEALVKERDKTAFKLEGAEVKLSKAANQQRLKMLKKNTPLEDPIKWVDENKRPTHKLGFLGLIGQKVDSIDWCRGHLQTLIPEVEKSQAEHWNGKAKFISACFIEFETIQAAEAAYQTPTKEKKTKLEARAICSRPDEVVWANLGKGKAARKTLHYAAVAAVTLLIIFWIPFVAFVGLLTNINYLTNKVSFLSFINDIPPAILGVVTGLIPVILLSVLLAIVPIFFRIFSKKSGQVTNGGIEMEVHSWYFAFQVMIGFIITTLSSGAAAVVTQILNKPSTAPTLLAQSLPKASNFYISFVLSKAVGSIGLTFLNIGALAVFYLLKSLLMKTPRKRFNQYTKVGGLGWGSLYPTVELYIVIALAYSIIAPLILGFTCIGIFLYYIGYRYMLIYVLDTSQLGTQGKNYPRALQHVMISAYISLVCLIGLLIIESTNEVAATGPLVIVIILLVAVIVAHVLINRTVTALIKSGKQREAAEAEVENGGVSENKEGSEPSHALLYGGGADLRANQESALSTSLGKKGLNGMILRVFRPKSLPPFADHFAAPAEDYLSDVRREAYLDPAITSPTPLLWLVHDDMGISAREKELSGKVLGTTDQGAYWEDKKGKLVTLWEDQPIEKQNAIIKEAPIYEEKPRY